MKYDSPERERFLAALQQRVADIGHGAQVYVCREAKISPSTLNDILHQRSFGKPAARLKIALALGYPSYEAMLEWGDSILARKNSENASTAREELGVRTEGSPPRPVSSESQSSPFSLEFPEMSVLGLKGF
ncbi:MAG: hypothetical protein LBO66_01035 [Deltaproteobacteria bacterium]|jgi:hypothetical protein|nr:hypothetical protein [Deltaproteobacteria bacterium]